MNYRVTGLSPDPFTPLFALSDGELASRGAVRRIADEPNAFPCRVTLEEATPGEEVLLLTYKHHPGPSPYQSSGPIYVRSTARTAYDEVNRLPAMQMRRLSSVRAYDAAGFLIVADVVPGGELEALVQRFLEEREVDYVHVHNARPGCFAFRIDRA
jgi:Protein of unknown function (DUF1203)